MKVLKFGGSSVANAENIEKVINIVSESVSKSPCIVVLSAMQGTTDELIAAARAAESGSEGFRMVIDTVGRKHFDAIGSLLPSAGSKSLNTFVRESLDALQRTCEGVFLLRELSRKTLDRILSFGELLSTRIVSEALTARGIENKWKDSRELVRTDSNFGSAAVDFRETNRAIGEHFTEERLPLYIIPGFIASDKTGATTTLGRGGSDYTAAILAAALNAEMLEIWTDVSGMMTADPRFVRNVREIPQITYREAMELSHFGAKVIYPPTIQPVMAAGIPVLVKNTFDPQHAGTLVVAKPSEEREMIRGISSIGNICVLNLEGSGMVGIPGFSKRLFESLSRAMINVILITQSSSEHSICVAIEEKSGARAKEVVDREFEHEISVGKIEPLRVDNGFSILAVVGDNMKAHTGVSGKMFSTLGQNGINIHAIAQGSSERNISVIINSNDVRKAVNTLHEEFFSDGKKQVNLFIAGLGTVGGKLLDQISRQQEYLLDVMRLNLRVIGAANSRQMLFDGDGLKLNGYAGDLPEAEKMEVGAFAENILQRNLRNSIFVDMTASPEIIEIYPRLLERSVSIVACNKIACSSEYAKYLKLKELAREYNANFLFETNVGAGLPVINTLNDLLRSGDQVNRIDAVLSGTLNFVFNHYDGTQKFAEVVRQAQAEGYTEPDPRLDLSGTDVARKILILAREAGHPLEMSDIRNVPFLPESCFDGDVDEFYTEMERNEDHFARLLENARSSGLSLKYIASFSEGAAEVGLQNIGPDHNFANLSGKDNAVLFYTNRYAEQPLVIKGAGAGADVTAAGVFADIIRTART